MARPDELVMLRAVSKLKDYVVFAWTSKGDLWHIMSPMALVPPWGEYYPRLCTREQFEKLALVDVSLEQTQGGRALASNSYSYGGHFVHSLRLGTGAPISFTAGVSPESEFVRLEFYCRDESQPFLTADNIKVDMRWYQDTNAVARVVTRPKDEYKLILETKVADPDDPSDPDTPGHDCPGYVVVEGARGIYHGPMRYYPKDGWVRLRPVANPGYRFVKWETSENVTGAVLFFGTPFIEIGINAVAEERIAVRMDDDTTITAVFKWDPIKVVQLAQGDLPEREIREEDDPATPDIREDVATISAAPAMPELRVSLNGGRSDVPVEWRLKVEYREGNRQDYFFAPQWDQGPGETEEEEDENAPRIQRIGNQTWEVDFRGEFVGGNATVYTKFCDGQTARKTFRIWGYNPPRPALKAFLGNLTVRVVCYQESRFHQFGTTPGIWSRWNEGPLSVLASSDHGFGLMQLTSLPAPPNDNPNVSGVLPDGRPGVRQLWNWQANCQAGQEYLNICAGWVATYWQEVHDSVESFSNLAEWEAIPEDQFRAHPDLLPFTAEQFRLELWSRYNSHGRYHNWDVKNKKWVRRRNSSDPDDDSTGCGYADKCNKHFNDVLSGSPPALWGDDPQ